MAEADKYVYNMRHPSKGVCLIINNEIFDKSNGLTNREGSSLDADRLQACFKEMNFEIRRFDNLGVMQMIQKLEKVAQEDHSSNCCFVLALLTEGLNDRTVYGADGNAVDIADLVEPFKGHNCPGLVGKAKVFIFEGSRGKAFDEGAGLEECDAEKANDTKTIPHEADVIYAFSTVPGYISWRNTKSGSWYISTLCAELQRRAHQWPLLWILDHVSHIVAHELESRNSKYGGMKQMPQIVSQLTKMLYLNK